MSRILESPHPPEKTAYLALEPLTTSHHHSSTTFPPKQRTEKTETRPEQLEDKSGVKSFRRTSRRSVKAMWMEAFEEEAGVATFVEGPILGVIMVECSIRRAPIEAEAEEDILKVSHKNKVRLVKLLRSPRPQLR